MEKSEKKLSSKLISTNQTPEINNFVPKIQPEKQKQRHLTIKSFAENNFSVFTETVLSKLDDITKQVSFCQQDIKNLQKSFDDFKQLKCKCKRRADRYSLS